MKAVPKILFLISIFSIIFYGCVITRTPGLYTGYNRLNESDKEDIVFLNKDSNICNLKDHNKIFAVTGKQLRACLKNNDTSIVYIWAPDCHSQSCILVSACQQYCSSKNYNLYVVAEYYSIKKMQIQNVSDFPMLTSNQRYYKIEFVDKLYRHFSADLTDGEILKNENAGYRFLVFKGDRFIKGKSDLFEN